MKSLLKYLLPLIVLFSGVAQGQIVVDSEYGPYQIITFALDSPPEAQALWEVKPLDGQNEYTYKQFGETYVFMGQPGRYQIEATVVLVDFEAKSFEIKKYSSIFKRLSEGNPPTPPPGPTPPGPTPPGPTPPPTPDPAVPNDEFGNLGQRLDSLCDQLGLQYDLRVRVSEVYAEASTRMTQPGGFLTIKQAKTWIETQLSTLSLDSSWQKTQLLLQEDAKQRTPMSWEAAYNWYRAAATGYKGAPLTTSPAIWTRSVVDPPLTTVITATELCPNGQCYAR